MSTYTKSALDTPDLLGILKQRGLVITNEPDALHTLSVISYFRLASFFRPLEADKHTHQFRQGCTLEQVMALCEFDTSLRDLVFSATRIIEIALRTRMNHRLSMKHKPFWFTNVDLATDGHLFTENLSSVDRELRRSKEEFIKEHFARYTKPTFPPAWKTLETVSFIWNRRYAVKPQMPRRINGRDRLTDFSFPPDKLYPQLCCIAYLLNSIAPENTFAADIKALLQKYPTVNPAAMGMVTNWQDEPLWK